MRRTIIILFSLASLCIDPVIKAQSSLEGYFDLGKSQVSEGFYLQFSDIGSFEKSKWGMDAGYQLGLVQPQNVFFNSWYASPYGKIRIGNIPLELGGEYLWTAISHDLRETNWILFARTTLTHWQLGLGTSTRIYRLSNKAADDADSRITEKWNIMYHATYMLKPYENRWNLSFSLRNYDHFIIQQENNPMYNLRFDYKLSTPLSVYSELWYKSAGLMVIKVTYFGMFFRIGLLWRI
jgi:hypothetical protein